MAKTVADHSIVGYRDLGGNAFSLRDSRLIGMGNPPADPEFARTNPGAGRFPMDKRIVPVGDVPVKERPSESEWIETPAA